MTLIGHIREGTGDDIGSLQAGAPENSTTDEADASTTERAPGNSTTHHNRRLKNRTRFNSRDQPTGPRLETVGASGNSATDKAGA
jgi:hypothetical protein